MKWPWHRWTWCAHERTRCVDGRVVCVSCARRLIMLPDPCKEAE